MVNRVLIADDVPQIRKLLTRLFRDCQEFDVVGEAGDGQEAIARCRDLQPDVILLDINMPGHNGFEALGDVREATPDALIVIFTGLAESALRERVLQLGADAYIEKGTPGREVVERLSALVAERTG